MKTANVIEMRTINGGATYSERCCYCNKKISTKYVGWSWLSFQVAKMLVGSKMHGHQISCFSNKYGY